MRINLVWVIIFLVISCKTETNQSDSALSDPIKLYNDSPTKESATRLAQTIINELNADNLTPTQEKNLLEQGLKVTSEQQLWPQAGSFLNSFLRSSDGSRTQEYGKSLIEVMEKIGNTEAITSLKFAFNKAFQDSPYQITQSIDTDIDSRIERLSASMFNDSIHQFDQNLATQFVDACEAYAMMNPRDPKSLDYLHKAGETSRSTRNFRKAISIYDWIYDQFPNDSRSSQALFLKAFTYDNDLKDLGIAKGLYEEYLKKYPNEDFADDTQFLLKNLGKSDEEILKELSDQ